MKTRPIVQAALVGALLAGTALSPSAQDYNYTGPVTSRDSGLTCVGGTLSDEQNLDREPDRGAVIKKGTPVGNFIQVFCPLTRRNQVPYGKQPNTSDFIEPLLIDKVMIFVRALSSSGALSCRVYAFRARYNDVLETDTKYACATAGGCSQSPASTRAGWTSLVFDFPFGTEKRVGEGIVNIGYRCYLPDNRSGIIGSEAEFAYLP